MMIGPPPDQITSGSSSLEDGNQQLNRGVVSPFINLHDDSYLICVEYFYTCLILSILSKTILADCSIEVSTNSQLLLLPTRDTLWTSALRSRWWGTGWGPWGPPCLHSRAAPGLGPGAWVWASSTWREPQTPLSRSSYRRNSRKVCFLTSCIVPHCSAATLTTT